MKIKSIEMELLRSINISNEPIIRMGKDDDKMKREFIVSTPRLDGHRSIIPIDSWDYTDFNKAGAFYYQHQTGAGVFTDANPDNALGPAEVYKEENRLIGIGKFEPEEINPLAHKILQKVDYGTLRTTSVGFISGGEHWGNERQGEDPTVLYFEKSILKEWSIVHIPSNPDAMKRYMEPMSNFILKASATHQSKGFQSDLKHRLRRMQLSMIDNIYSQI